MNPATNATQSWGRVRNRDGLVTKAVIGRLVRDIAERFRPDRIILFGSYAYGQPDRDSDIDLLVTMPARNEIDLALRIEQTVDPPFSIDVVVRTPKNMQWRLEDGDWFLREVVARGKVVYEKDHRGVGAEGRSGALAHCCPFPADAGAGRSSRATTCTKATRVTWS
jgi:predicted nucleotidyltransferase